MLSILATILSWDDAEREKAGLQKVGKGKAPPIRRKSSHKDAERSAEEEAAMNEVSDLRRRRARPGMVAVLSHAVLFESLCRVFAQRGLTRPSSSFTVAQRCRPPVSRYQVAPTLHPVLTQQLRPQHACPLPKRSAFPQNVDGLERLVIWRTWSIARHGQKSQLRPVGGHGG